jgi:Plasmid recombination enzyme
VYSIIRKRKHKSIASLRSRENHTYRREPTPNADPAKLHKNKLLFGSLDYADSIESELKQYTQSGKNIRKNAVLSIEYLLTASPEFFAEGSKNERDERLKKWCEAQIEFVKKEHGEKNIACMYLHLDEKTPHIEVFVVPIDPKGKLNCKYFLGARNALSILQTKYATHNAKFGLKRGQTGSRATHQEVKKFYEQIKTKSKVTSQDLQKAVKIDLPTISERLDPTIFLD